MFRAQLDEIWPNMRLTLQCFHGNIAQKIATENVFRKRNIPFRSFNVLRRSEQALGELFTFFMMETILLGELTKVNPFDQPSVELIKIETNKILKN